MPAPIRLNVNAGYTRGESDALRALTQDIARLRVENAGVPDLTDNSTGTAAATIVNMLPPTAAFDATAAGGALRTGFNTAVDKFEDACRVLTNSLNNVAARVGLPRLTALSGTQATANVIPALDKTVTTTNGATSLDYAGGRTTMQAVRRNMNDLVNHFNRVMDALGNRRISSSILGGDVTDTTLEAIPDAAASATGASAVSKATADAFLTAVANNIATLALYWNGLMFQTGMTDLTDSSGGTPAQGLAANAAPALAAGAATTSSPKAGFDGELVKIENNLSDLTLRMNALRLRHNLTAYTDSTGVSPNTTIEALLVALTAVDGTLAANGAVRGADARARIATINNALSSLRVGINEVADLAGVQQLTDALLGTPSTTIADVAATGTAVGQDTVPGGTLLDADVDAWLVINRNNISTLAAKLNEITGTDTPTRPMQVVAA